MAAVRMRGMLVVFGVCCLIAGLVGILFPRHIAEFVVRSFRMMGASPDAIPLLSVFYRVLGVVQLGLGVAVLVYKVRQL
jgi:Na+(H+)/acetate symporter ActP